MKSDDLTGILLGVVIADAPSQKAAFESTKHLHPIGWGELWIAPIKFDLKRDIGKNRLVTRQEIVERECQLFGDVPVFADVA